MNHSNLTGQRRAEHWLRPLEAWLLPRLAASLPAWVMPDHLTALGAAAALAAGWCFAHSGDNTAYFWWANLGIFLNWLGDSLDGTLARLRQIERPRYGFYLDHMCDMLSVAALFLGLGASGHLQMSVALLVVLAYYLLAIHSHLEAKTLGVFRIAHNGMGPTEGRLLLMAISGALALDWLPTVAWLGAGWQRLDAVAMAFAAAMLAMAVFGSVKNLLVLAKLEPPARPQSAWRRNLLKSSAGR